jgi:ABC-2 type transport system ATP-binding protein
MQPPPHRSVPPENALEIQSLTKIYGGGKTALDAVTLNVPRGMVFGLLGPNGAGKSTVINVLAGLVNKTAGTAKVWGIDIDASPRDARGAIGVVPQELNIDPFFTPKELLELQAGLYGVPHGERRTMEILAAVGLADKANSYARTLSGGMRRRLLVAKALVHAPPVLVLDEPTAGVDIELRQGLWAYVRELNRAGTTVVLTTHYLQEAEELCDRIAIINCGKLVADESKAALLARLDAKELRLTLERDLDAVPPALAAFGAKLEAPRVLVVPYRPSRTRAADILAAASQASLAIADLSTRESDLEDVFLQLVRQAA